MSSRSRETLKLTAVIAVAFGLGLTLAQAFDLPRAGRALTQQTVLGTPALQQVAAPVVRGPAGALPSFADVVERVNPSVVFIRIGRRAQAQERPRNVPPEFQDFFRRYSEPRYSTGQGSGFIVSRDGYILTNNHVVADADQVTVRLSDNREFTARVIGRDPNTDVAVIKIDATDLPTAAFGNSDHARIGDWVLAIGNPLGFTFTVTAGIISAKGRALDLANEGARYQIQDFIQTDAAINPGNSGGPLLNLSGEVVGINSAIASQTGFYSGYGFAIPINLARRVMADLIRTGRVERAILGINIQDVTPEDAAFVGLSEIRGVLVQRFPPDADSPARRAGLELGDVIVAVNDTAVAHVAQLQQLVGFKRPGEVVRVTVVRNENGRKGVRRTFDVRLAAADEAEAPRMARDAGANQPAEFEGRLGVRVEGMTAQQVQRNRIPEDRLGVVVADVEEGGPSWGRLADASDPVGPTVILAVNGARVRTVEEFNQSMRRVPRGDVVQLRVVFTGERDSQPRVVTVRSR